MKTHRLHCQDPWFTFIKNGIKSVEGRKNLPTFLSWQPKDKVVFFLGNNQFNTEIVALRRYNSLEDYLTNEKVEKVLPGITSLSEAIRIYLQWSSKEEIEQLGFLAIEVRRMS